MFIISSAFDENINIVIKIVNENFFKIILSDVNFSLLHCVTIYPTQLKQFHLSRMQILKKMADSIGFSDHSLVVRDGIRGSLCAIYLGAEIIERHFTVLKADETKDGPVSINKKHLKYH